MKIKMKGNNYYPTPTFPGAATTDKDTAEAMELTDEKNIIDILKLNKGKLIKIYCSYPHTETIKDKTFEGIIEIAGPDFLIISNRSTGQWSIILINNINYITCDEKINYRDKTT